MKQSASGSPNLLLASQNFLWVKKASKKKKKAGNLQENRIFCFKNDFFSGNAFGSNWKKMLSLLFQFIPYKKSVFVKTRIFIYKSRLSVWICLKIIMYRKRRLGSADFLFFYVFFTQYMNLQPSFLDMYVVEHFDA